MQRGMQITLQDHTRNSDIRKTQITDISNAAQEIKNKSSWNVDGLISQSPDAFRNDLASKDWMKKIRQTSNEIDNDMKK